MYLLGLLSIMQMVFIPGFIVLKFFRFHLESKIQTLVYSFGLSLLINYLLVYVLTVAKIYKPAAIYTIFLIEILLLVYYLKKSTQFRINFAVKDPADQFSSFLKSNSVYYNILLLVSFIFIILYFSYFFSSFGSVFTKWDAMVSWNRWATSWAANQLPTLTFRYPQLIPANWSITYVMIQNANVQLFAKSIMSLFPIATLFLFMDLALRKKDLTYLVALIAYGSIIRAIFTPGLIVDGYVDIAITFFAFLAFYVCYSNEVSEKNILLGIIFACASAVTKQAGIYILAVMIAWSLWTLFKNRKNLSLKKISRIIVSMTVIVIAIFLSWYIYISILIDKKIEVSEKGGISFAMNSVHGDRNLGQRLIYSFERLVQEGDFNTGLVFGLLLFFLAFSLFHKKSRKITLLIVIPFTLIWGFFFSYDNRNLALAFPFIALSCAYGLMVFFDKLIVKTRHQRQYKFSLLYLSVLIVSVTVFLNFTIYSKKNLTQNQHEQKTQIGVPQLNKFLYNYEATHGFKGKIFSAYQYLAVLPELKHLYVPLPYYEKITVKKHINGILKMKDIHYFLTLKRRIEPDAQELINKKIKKGEYIPIFSFKGYQLFKIR
ncbi:MAG: hypothetical protein GTO45_07505 [Candidatus Aminicenantes bacterium]|nr:hypothetical protein [Candidatus Aminicenantes bacterium]NIM78682.1 hypothetical protein [Candidatus Aminicenantes bacterium]NIN17929.1 hypothetical protein [Candidatus Aminicenantes bacterium]NIN41832.1 hypothetical protein [Candidatus Aminicenantes bacterium]NIN84584.1 hypothetical protein [Candidatus Aminicenantes bacterium]